MGWASIVALILELVGPLLEKWMAECTADRLESASAELPPATSFASQGDAATALFDKAIDDLPRFAFVRRRALERMRDKSVEGDKLRTAPFTAEELREARDIVGHIRPQ
jgi:hypothetical protein